VGNKVVWKGMHPWGKKQCVKNDRYHNDRGEKGNPMRQVSNKGVGKTQTLFLIFFISSKL